MQRKRRDRARSSRHTENVPSVDEIVLIERIGHQGDGIAQTDDGSVFVPFAAPGDRVRISRVGNRGDVREIMEPGPDRQKPPSEQLHCQTRRADKQEEVPLSNTELDVLALGRLFPP